MINHKYKCIFIHISKCAGTSVENAFGLLEKRINKAHYDDLYGWCEHQKIFLHHATPQELFDFGFIDETVWNTYYKFIIIRDPWDRAYSDYIWMLKQIKGVSSFEDFLKKEGLFKSKLTQKSKYYRGDHLKKQIDYLYLNGAKIDYDRVIRFENLNEELQKVEIELNLPQGFFKTKKNVATKKFKHYSQFYNNYKKELLNSYFKEDITMLPYEFNNKFAYCYLCNLFFLFYHFGIKTGIKKKLNRFYNA